MARGRWRVTGVGPTGANHRSSSRGAASIAVGSLAILAAACSALGGPSSPEVEAVEFGLPVAGVHWVDDESIGVSLDGGGFLEFAPANGGELRRILTTPGIGPVRAAGAYWFRRCDEDPLTDVPRIGPAAVGDGAGGQLVRIDPDSVVIDAVVESFDVCRAEWLVAHEDAALTTLDRIDLTTGESQGQDLPIVEASVHGGELWALTTDGWFWRQEGGALTMVARPWTVEYGLLEPSLVNRALEPLREVVDPASGPMIVPHDGFTLRHWDGRLWVWGDLTGQPGQAVELDPTSGQLGSSVPVENVPLRTVEGEGYRVELFGDGHAWDLDADDGEWRLTDTSTSESFGGFDFGSFQPRGVAGGSIWLIDPEAGILGRVRLADLVG